MSDGREFDDAEGDALPKPSLLHRLLLALPRLRGDGDKPPLGERLRSAVLKPVEPGTEPGGRAGSSTQDRSLEELEAAVRYADDKERLVGLLAAPVAAMIALIVIGTLISKDPHQFLANGQPNKNYVSLSLYHTLELVLLVLAVLMLATAWFRKRLLLGMVMALYGLGVFNLHWWGFGIPFIMGAAWLLVRSYRLQRDLREATEGGPTRPGSRGRGRAGPGTAGPKPNKRYTPKAPPRRLPPKPEDEKRAG
jgi:hypothetical protein